MSSLMKLWLFGLGVWYYAKQVASTSWGVILGMGINMDIQDLRSVGMAFQFKESPFILQRCSG